MQDCHSQKHHTCSMHLFLLSIRRSTSYSMQVLKCSQLHRMQVQLFTFQQ